MHKFLLVGAVVALSACGSGGNKANSANGANASAMNSAAPMAPAPMEQNGAMMPPAGNVAMNSANSTAQNMMMKDMKTNDPDTNLANGM
jgi:hypothetical protein